jgi:hypothetical protein
MPSLVDILKERAAVQAACSVKSADLAEFESKLSQGGVNPSSAVPEFEQAAIEHYRGLIQSGQMTPAEAHRLLRQRLKDRPSVEQQALESGSSLYTPSYLGAGTTLGVGAGLSWGLNKLLSGKDAHPIHEHVGSMLSPSQLLPRTADPTTGKMKWSMSPWALLPLGAASAFYLTRPLQDPAYQRGEKGYFSSLASAIGGSGRESRRRMSEAEQNYGTLGAMPLHALNFAMDPLGGIAAAGTKVKDVLTSKEGELWDKAAEAVERGLRDS